MKINKYKLSANRLELRKNLETIQRERERLHVLWKTTPMFFEKEDFSYFISRIATRKYPKNAYYESKLYKLYHDAELRVEKIIQLVDNTVEEFSN